MRFAAEIRSGSFAVGGGGVITNGSLTLISSHLGEDRDRAWRLSSGGDCPGMNDGGRFKNADWRASSRVRSRPREGLTVR
jgi:hypothetical protein